MSSEDKASSRKASRSERSSRKASQAQQSVSTSIGESAIKPVWSAEDKEFLKTLTSHAWYHGMMPRHEIEELLKKDGDFLMRATDVKGVNRLCVSVFRAKRVRHILIKQDSAGEWHIRADAAKDKSLIGLIQTHIDKKLPVQPEGTLLMTAISRPDYYILHENVEVKDRLGGGNFGDVHKAVLKQTDGKCIDVAVKKLKAANGKKGRQEFIKEAKIVRDLKHENIVELIGVAPQEEPMLIVLELCKGGSLENYLKKNPDVKLDELSIFTKDACRGMRYLSEKKVIHRDLAARNCLLGEGKVVKISDFGLAQESEVFKLDRLKNVPIRWLSPETLNRGEFSTKTDVWSFGVLMWEIYSRCVSEPYPKLSNAQVKTKIQSGHEPMAAPEEMPALMSLAMNLCFTQNSLQRPDFAVLYSIIAPGEK